MRKSIVRNKKNRIKPDAVYQNLTVSQIINLLMKNGKKSVSEKIFYRAMINMRILVNEDPLDVLLKCIEISRPLVELKSIRIGGVTLQIPVEINEKRKNSLAIRWIIASARNRSENRMEDKLAKELFDIYQNKGLTVQKKEELHKRAENNRAFAHYRW